MTWPVSPTAGLFHAVGDRFFIADGTAWRRYHGGFYELSEIVLDAVEEWGEGTAGENDEANQMGAFYELIHL